MKKLINLIVFILIAGLNGWAQEATEVIRVACVGNSITFGAGIANRDRDSYPSVLGQMLGRGYEVRNFGFSARTMLMKGDHPYMKEQMFQDALKYNPDIVVIKLGTNDSKSFNWKYKADLPKDMQTMVSAFKEMCIRDRYIMYMKAIQIPAPSALQVVDIAKPEAKSGEVLLKIKFVGFCGSDLNTFLGRNPMVKLNVIPGHEVGAVIEAIGPDVPAGFEPGMSVTVNPYTNCGTCAACRNGRVNACEHNETFGVQRNGAMGEYLSLPLSLIHI